jgi:dinuclear metal center YbgI/SA1388 family protein
MARFSVGDIESLLFEAYPATDALPEDRFGLLVGDRAAIVTRIAVALDQTVPMIEAAAAADCNLLVAHHPGFFKPEHFFEARSAAVADGAAVYKAVQKGVALLAMHTNLDCAPSAANMLLEPVGLEMVAPLRPWGTGSLGQVARPVGEQGFVLLETLVCAYRQAFGRVAKVWGDPAKPLFSVAVCSGGAGEVVPEVVSAGVDCFVTGELRHHEALYLADENIALIELGHDVSELPYRFVLREALARVGFPPGDIVILEPSAAWWQPNT